MFIPYLLYIFDSPYVSVSMFVFHYVSHYIKINVVIDWLYLYSVLNGSKGWCVRTPVHSCYMFAALNLTHTC